MKGNDSRWLWNSCSEQVAHCFSPPPARHSRLLMEVEIENLFMRFLLSKLNKLHQTLQRSLEIRERLEFTDRWKLKSAGYTDVFISLLWFRFQLLVIQSAWVFFFGRWICMHMIGICDRDQRKVLSFGSNQTSFGIESCCFVFGFVNLFPMFTWCISLVQNRFGLPNPHTYTCSTVTNTPNLTPQTNGLVPCSCPISTASRNRNVPCDWTDDWVVLLPDEMTHYSATRLTVRSQVDLVWEW